MSPAVRIDRDTAIAAIRAAAATLGCAPEEVSPQGYRAFRERAAGAVDLPSHLAIALLFGGWARAREQAATAWRLPG